MIRFVFETNTAQTVATGIHEITIEDIVTGGGIASTIHMGRVLPYAHPTIGIIYLRDIYYIVETL